MTPAPHVPWVTVHERAVCLDGEHLGVHTLRGATSAMTSSSLESWHIVAALEGITVAHPGDWTDDNVPRHQHEES